MYKSLQHAHQRISVDPQSFERDLGGFAIDTWGIETLGCKTGAELSIGTSPSTPVVPKPSTRLCVSRNGTRSGISKDFPYAGGRLKNQLRTCCAAIRGVYFFEQTVEVDVHDISSFAVEEYIFAMTIAETMGGDELMSSYAKNVYYGLHACSP
jgi:hypothetical protein